MKDSHVRHQIVSEVSKLFLPCTAACTFMFALYVFHTFSTPAIVCVCFFLFALDFIRRIMKIANFTCSIFFAFDISFFVARVLHGFFRHTDFISTQQVEKPA